MCRNSGNYCRTVGFGTGAFVGKTALENHNLFAFLPSTDSMKEEARALFRSQMKVILNWLYSSCVLWGSFLLSGSYPLKIKACFSFLQWEVVSVRSGAKGEIASGPVQLGVSVSVFMLGWWEAGQDSDQNFLDMPIDKVVSSCSKKVTLLSEL